MKKFLLISLILWLTILSGCSQQKWLSQNELFEKKQECIKYINIAEERIKYLETDNVSINIDDIFYNSQLNTCILWLKATYINLDIYQESYDIYDLLLKKPIKTAITKEDYNKKIQELKWE